jgi:Zn-dependent protease/predicted transcriptional regulator
VKASVRVGRVAGVSVGLHWSLLVIGTLLASMLAAGRFPAEAPGYAGVWYGMAGIATAVGFLASILAHEISHAIVARREGIGVRDITLWLLGGVTRMDGEAGSPGSELRVSGAGPLSSLILGLILGGLAIGLDAAGSTRLLSVALAWLAAVNLVLAVFNALPGAPLDGGRLLHALLWHRHGDRLKATHAASRAGEILGGSLVAVGFVEFALRIRAGGGLWLALVGWFLITAARAEAANAGVASGLAGLRVADVMKRDPTVAPAWMGVGEFIDNLPFRPHAAFPVENRQGQMVGLVTLDRLRAVAVAQRERTNIVDVAYPIAEVATLAPDEPAIDLIDKLAGNGAGIVPVVESDQLVGLITRTDMQRALRRPQVLSDSGTVSGHGPSPGG